MTKNAIIIGSGIAGLAAAIRLANKGFAVKVFEANAHPGGKITEISRKDYRFDAGPSLFTLPHLVDELFRLSGKEPKDYFRYKKNDIACRYFWEDGTDLTAWADREKFATEAANKTGASKMQILQYLDRSREIYNTTAPVFLENSLHKWENYFSKETLSAITKIHKLNLLGSLNSLNEKKLKNPKIIQLFNRFATYNGSSPYLTPGVMSSIPHLEHNLGSFYPEGGMHQIVMSLFRLAQDLGVEFHFEEKVDEILVEVGETKGIKTKRGFYYSDVVFSNMDVVPTYRHLLPQEKAPEKALKQPRSSSALIFYWGIKKQFPQLDLHNIFFSEDYREEFRQIFEKGDVSDDLTVYINITSKEEPADAPEGCENWFVMVNVPPNTGQDWTALTKRTRKNVIKKLDRMLGTELHELIEYEETLDPVKLEEKTSSYQGALYGAAGNNTMAAFLRHPNFTSKIKGLYFCGGSVHPGGGIPLCLLSAKIAVGLVE